MARFDVVWSGDFEQQIKNLADKFDDIAPKMIDSALPRLVNSIKKRLKWHRQTGALEESVTAYKAKAVRGGGYYGRVGFAGDGMHKYANKTQKVPNAIKAAGLEYGSSKQSPQPFLRAAINDAEKDCIDAMQKTFNAEAGI